MNPLASIILPTYNAGQQLSQAVESVYEQTYKHWELIIVNDGSTDCTDTYLKTITDQRIQIIHQPNKGVSAARNAGLEIAKGEYVAFLDADDILPPVSLESRIGLLANKKNVDVVDGIVSIRNDTMEKQKRLYQPYYEGVLFPKLLKLDDRVFFGPSYMFRRALLGHTRFNENMTHAEDLLFYLTMSSNKEVYYSFVEEIIYHYRVSGSSAMANMAGLEQGYIQLLKQVRNLNGVKSSDLLALKLKIAKILLLSWRAKGYVGRGVTAACKAVTQ